MKSYLIYFSMMGLLLMGSLPDASAEDCRTVEESSAQEIVGAAGGKFGRGVANAATGWMELPKQIYVTAHEEGAVQAIFLGPLKGIGMALVRTLAGVGELATFIVPYPGFYDPWIEPKYVWQPE